VHWFADSTIWTNRFANGSWGTAMRIDPAGSVGASFNASLVVDRAGTGILAYTHVASRQFVNTSRFTGAAWSTPVEMPDDPTHDAFAPLLAIDSADTVTAVWYQEREDRYELWASRTTATGWGTAVPVATEETFEIYLDDVATDEAGNVIVVWNDVDRVWTARYRGGWQAALDLDITTNFVAELAVDPTGTAFLATVRGNEDEMWINAFR
jgi:hypothetical protein